MAPGCQMVVGGAHGVVKDFTDTTESDEGIGYTDGTLGDNIYNDESGADDTYLMRAVDDGGGSPFP